LSQPSGIGVARHLVLRRVRHIFAEPVAALAQSIALAVNAANLRLIAIGQQVVMHAQANFRANFDMRQADEHLERVGDAAIGRVL